MGNYAEERARMVMEQLEYRGLRNVSMLNAFRHVPRHLFVPEGLRSHAYDDRPLETRAGQTISQPYIVALMTELLLLTPEPLTILEVGTGSGYQAAVLAYLGHHVISIERLPELIAFAEDNLSKLDLTGDIQVIEGDGSPGYPPEAPYDRIIVTAAAPAVPCQLVAQLKIGGRLVIPCGSRYSQILTCIDRISDTETRQTLSVGCCFVPLIGTNGF